MEKAGEEAGVSIAALEEKNKALTDEAAKLRGSLEAETQKSAELQEEVDVLSANPGALQKRLLVLAGANEAEQKEGLRALAGVILRVFRESIPADTEGGVTHPVAVSVLVDGEDAMTISYDLTKAQEAQAYEAAGKLNDAQKLFRIDLNHDQTAAVVINGTAFSKEAFEAVRAEVFSRNPAASKAELIRLTTDELVRTLVLREHAEAAGIDPDAEDMESRLWEEALKTVAVNDEEFAAALEKRQQEEDAVLAADPAQYARMLEEGRIASAVLPEGSRFIKQLIVTVDVSCMEKISASLKDAEGKLKTVTARINDQSSEKEKEERKTLARQVNQLTNELNLLQSKEKKAKETAAALASSIRRNQTTFEVASALAERDEAMPAVGYAVFKGAQVPDEKLVAAALALEHPGDVSEPIRLADGFHVLYYSEEITPDSDVIQKAQEMLRQEMLEPLKKAMQESLLNKWIGEAQVVSNVK